MAAEDTRPLALLLTYDPTAPSFRHRIAPVIAPLQALGYRCRVEALPEQQYGWRIWRRRALLRDSAVVVLQKLRLPAFELRLLRGYCDATVFDVDDAIWTRQPKYVGHTRRPSRSRIRRFEAMCRGSTLVTAGNPVLAERARMQGGRCVIVPTPVDATAYPAQPLHKRSGRTLVWVGMPGNVQYLTPLRPVLSQVAMQFPGLTLRVVSSAFPDWNDVQIERVAWSAAVEKEALASADIGLMPLVDDEYTRGKCAFKLLQYMAAGLPCVASPVGANCDVVQHGSTGFLATTSADWAHALTSLLADSTLREGMGACGRSRVLAHYDSRAVAVQMAELIDAVARGKPVSGS
jgi:hypothetical protein